MKKKGSIWLILGSLILSGCQLDNEKSVQPVGQTVQLNQLATDVQGEFKEAKQLAIIEKKTVKRNEAIPLEIQFDPKEKGMEQFTEIADVFQDAELTQSVAPYYKLNKAQSKLDVRPPRESLGAISSSDVLGTEIGIGDFGTEMRDHTLFAAKENENWGNLSQYYLAIYVDLKTGEALKKPEVIVFTVETEISETPKLKIVLNGQGVPEFSWNKVKGAAYYYIMEIAYTEKGFDNQGFVKAKTKSNKWQPGRDDFTMYRKSELEKIQESDKALSAEEAKPDLKEDYSSLTSRYVVIAVNKKGTSSISNDLTKLAVAQRMPLYKEEGYNRQKEGELTTDSFESLPSYQWVTMADGTLVQKLIEFDTSRAIEETSTFFTVDGEEEVTKENVKVEKVDTVTIPYVIEGTHFFGQAKVTDYDSKTFKKELKTLAARQNKLRNKAGVKEFELTFDGSDEEDGKTEESVTYETSDKVTANSPLSKYLAINMLAGKQKISLEAFPEAMDQDYLFDAWMEAVYQNPLILGVEKASISPKGNTLMVSYELDKAEMIEKQVQLRKEVKFVVSKIITKGMTDIEKEIALNNYLIKEADYDNEALLSAESTQFVSVDKTFTDSFSPYGVLINKLGVCASYAGAFKLLADEAGLESIVVTGHLDGDLPHAWNRVKIDEQWLSLDPTNNDDDYLENALLNVPDTTSKKVLVEDDKYVMNQALANYRATAKTSEHEYYHVTNAYFERDKISDELVKRLKSDKKVALRTDYQLNDQLFNDILTQTQKKLSDESLRGFYWLGVIYLER